MHQLWKGSACAPLLLVLAGTSDAFAEVDFDADYSPSADCSTDDSTKLQDAIDDIETAGGGEVLKLGPYCYHMGSTRLVISQTMTLKGESGLTGGASTRLVWSSNASGIYIQRDHTSASKGGQATQIENIYLESSGTSTSAHGIEFDAPSVILRNVTVDDFGGNGVHVVADVNNNTNANRWMLFYVESLNNENGIYIDGGDTNAGISVGFNGIHNESACIRSDSFLGNTWIGGHCADNPDGIVESNSSAQSTFIGQYVEGTTDTVDLNAKTIWIGGIGGDFSGSSGAYLTGNQLRAGSLYFNSNDDARVRLGDNSWTDAPIYLDAPGHTRAPHAMALHYDIGGTANDGWWQWCFLNGATTCGPGIATNKVGGSGEERGQFWAQYGTWLGGRGTVSSSRVFMGTASSAPTSSAYPTGSVFYNTTSSAVVGWRYDGTNWTAF